jgi:hypothetical protein
MSTMTDQKNAETSRAEVEAFHAEQPDRYFAYHSGTNGVGWHLTTWTGDTLAYVDSVGQTWRSNLGDLRQSFRARTSHGVVYSGVAYLDAGGYVRMRKVAS